MNIAHPRHTKIVIRMADIVDDERDDVCVLGDFTFIIAVFVANVGPDIVLKLLRHSGNAGLVLKNIHEESQPLLGPVTEAEAFILAFG